MLAFSTLLRVEILQPLIAKNRDIRNRNMAMYCGNVFEHVDSILVLNSYLKGIWFSFPSLKLFAR